VTLSLDELKATLHEIADHKAPGLDGFPCDFYKAAWKFVGLDMLKIYHEALVSQFPGTTLD
jgi:hypothetical protein